MIKRTSIEARFCRKHKTSDQGKKISPMQNLHRL